MCRAVAVKVLKSSSSRNLKADTVKKDKGQETNVETAGDSSAFSYPPEMPIIIDEAAVEDILGVGCFF